MCVCVLLVIFNYPIYTDNLNHKRFYKIKHLKN